MANNKVILQWNCRGLLDKRLEIELILATYSPAILCLQETLLPKETETKTENELDPRLKFRGYKGYFKCIKSGKNGIATYVKNGVFHHHMKKLKTTLQALAVTITKQGKEFIVCNHYISDKHDNLQIEHLNSIHGRITVTVLMTVTALQYGAR